MTKQRLPDGTRFRVHWPLSTPSVHEVLPGAVIYHDPAKKLIWIGDEDQNPVYGYPVGEEVTG